MILHDLKCIFVHIPRCAGTSIEQWLAGRDWWSVDAPRKHLTARQAQVAYAPWWDSYFTFAVVRDPVARTRSCLKYADHFGLRAGPGGAIDLAGYHRLFGDRVVVEHDHRFYRRDDLLHGDHVAGAVYGNILDAPVDFVARFEDLATDMARVARQLGVTQPFDQTVERSDREAPPVDAATQAGIAALYRQDIARFGY